MPKVKTIFYCIIAVVVSSALNFMVFLESYKRLAFPYMHEEQRVENAPYIFLYILPGFVLIAIISLILFKITANNMNR